MPKQYTPKQLSSWKQQEELINKYGSEYEFHKAKRVGLNGGLVAKQQKKEYEEKTGEDLY
jgi:hypothetical protein